MSFAAFGQDASAKKTSGLLGDLVAVDSAKGVLTIRATDGSTGTAAVSPATEYLRVQPGQTSLDGAEHITMAELASGDRVWARGTERDAAGALVAHQVILMSAKSIGERRERDSRDWRARGTFGTVKAVDAAKGEITVESFRGETVVVTTTSATVVRKLKPGATDLSGAQSIALGDVAVGSQVAVRGERSADGTHLAASDVLTGTFPRPIRGRVTSIDSAKGEVRLTSQDGHVTTLIVDKDASVRKFAPPEGGWQRRGADGARGGATRPENAGPGRPPGAPGGFSGIAGDRAELEKRTTPITLADIAPGDVVFAMAAPGSTGDSVHVNALVKVEFPANRGPRQMTGGEPQPAPGDVPNQ